MKRVKPTPGHQPILTKGFGTRGQVDLIDFQSIKDGEFKFLLNYIDHGLKMVFSIPIVAKRASTIALALFQLFTVIGPPAILQSDNGKEFHLIAIRAKAHSMIDDELLLNIIQEIKQLWPDCRMVKGAPRYSPSNGGVERINLTVEQKLAKWMADNKSQRWSIAC